MFYKILIFVCLILVIGLGVTNTAVPQLPPLYAPQPHPANAHFNSVEYPRIGVNQITTGRIRRNPAIIRDLAKYDLVIINKSDDLFVDKDSSYQYARQIKAINPRIKVLQYLSISDLWNYQQSFKQWALQHPEVLLKDKAGNFVHPYADKYGKRRFMMDSTQTAWQDYFANRMKKITDQGMDGIFVDNLWRSNWQKLNISSDKFRQIQEGWEITLQKGRALIGPDKIILGNSPPFPLYQTRDITMLECMLKPDRESLAEYFSMTRTGNKYGQLNFDAVQYGKYNGTNFHYVPEFFLPAVLLTDNIWGFTYESSQWIQLTDKVGKIGFPAGPAKRLANGVWNRDFTRAKVLLNDTGSTKTFSLPAGNYVTLNNTPTDKVTLKPMQGIVLKKIGSKKSNENN